MSASGWGMVWIGVVAAALIAIVQLGAGQSPGLIGVLWVVMLGSLLASAVCFLRAKPERENLPRPHITYRREASYAIAFLVRNLGGPARFSASIQVIKVGNRPRTSKAQPFKASWAETEEAELEIGTHDFGTLRIALLDFPFKPSGERSGMMRLRLWHLGAPPAEENPRFAAWAWNPDRFPPPEPVLKIQITSIPAPHKPCTRRIRIVPKHRQLHVEEC